MIPHGEISDYSPSDTNASDVTVVQLGSPASQAWNSGGSEWPLRLGSMHLDCTAIEDLERSTATVEKVRLIIYFFVNP